MPDIHARLSASGSKKWMNCPASVELESRCPDEDSAYAAEGTAAHALGEAKLRRALNELTRVQYHKAISGLEITGEMEEYTDGYRDFVLEQYNRALAGAADAELQLESRLDFSAWVPGGFGTGDAVIVYDGHAHIIDLKYGRGVKVSAKNNSQLRLYALGALSSFDFLYDIQKITMTIYQPRIDNIDSETISVGALLAWGKEIHKKAISADYGGDPCAGAHCDEGFCRARPICRAYAEQKTRLAAMEFKKPAQLSNEEIAEVLDEAEKLAAWAGLVKDYALARALEGEKFPGFKVVEGKSSRVYKKTDSEIAETLIKSGFGEEDIYTKNLLGITKMEKLLGKNRFNALLGDCVIKPRGKPALARAEDKRPEWNDANADFEDLIEKE